MTHTTIIWVALVIGGIVTGAGFVAALVASRPWEPLAIAVTLVGFAGMAWGFGGVATAYDRLDAVGYALVFVLGAVAGGYALASTLLSSLARRPQPAPLPSVLCDDVGASAVVLLCEAEPAAYSASETAAALEDLAEEGLLKASVGVLPFLFMAQKTRYRAAGGTSPGFAQDAQLAERLGRALEREDVSSVLPARCEGDTSLAIRISRAAERGFRTIVVAEAIVADSLEVDRAKREVDALRLAERGVTVAYADPLWGSSRCAGLVASRALAVAGDPESSGVVLVGQGQPENRSRLARSFDEQETAFLNRTRMLIVERGVPEQNVRIAWADWRTPELTPTIRHLAALGCRRIVVSPACFPMDSITTMLDLPLSVRQARVDESVSVVTLPAWHDDPAVVEALRSRVARALEGTGRGRSGER